MDYNCVRHNFICLVHFLSVYMPITEVKKSFALQFSLYCFSGDDDEPISFRQLDKDRHQNRMILVSSDGYSFTLDRSRKTSTGVTIASRSDSTWGQLSDMRPTQPRYESRKHQQKTDAKVSVHSKIQ